MIKQTILAAAMLQLFVTQVALADADAIQTAKTLCAGCHGPAGIATNPLWPNLAGQNAAYTAKQLRAYRDGTRVDPSMTGLSSTLSDEQIDELAQYYAQLTP